MPHLRYKVRKNISGPYWSVIDIFTGRPAEVFGLVIDNLSEKVANEVAVMLNHRDLRRRGFLKGTKGDT